MVGPWHTTGTPPLTAAISNRAIALAMHSMPLATQFATEQTLCSQEALAVGRERLLGTQDSVHCTSAVEARAFARGWQQVCTFVGLSTMHRRFIMHAAQRLL